MRIKAREVPEKAMNWLNDSFEDIKKPKWYLEYSQIGKSYEAKFSFCGYFYSVEFDSLGKIEDVEVEIPKSKVSEEVWKKIGTYFESEFSQVKVEKVQRQFTGEPDDLEDFFDEQEVEGVTTRYEIVFEGKKEIWELWEALFDESGNFISVLKVEIRLNDNLIF